jgi:hypothetical protein
MTFSLFDLAFVGSLSAAPALWTPADITTALWLDAADASTITESSGAVSQWNDKSGNGTNATASSTARPTYSATSLNSKPGLTFDGTANVMRADALATIVSGNDTPWTTIFVGSLISGSTNRIALGFGSNVSAHDHFVGLSSADTFNTQRRDGSFARASLFGTSAVSSSKVFGMVFGGTTATLYQNGTLDATGALNVGSMGTAMSVFSLGAGFTNNPFPSGFTNCVFSEIIVMAGSIPTNIRRLIEGYLAHKWDLAADLPNDHPYKTTAPAL